MYAGISVIILLRTLPFVIFGRENNDSDEAVWGLIAKYFAQSHIVPIFMYSPKGQVGMERFPLISWMAAPLFALSGTASVAMLRLPLLVINLIVGNWLAYFIRREAGLGAWATFACCLWFVLPSAKSSMELMCAGSWSTEPFIFLLAMWALRKKPLLAGYIAGFGAACRPFVIYGVLSMLIIENRVYGNTRKFYFLAVQWATGVAAALGSGMLLALYGDTHWAFWGGNGSTFYLKRFRFMLEDLRGYFAEILTQTVGLQIHHFTFPFNDTIYYSVLGFMLIPIGVYLLYVLLRSLLREYKEIWCLQIRTERFQFAFYLIGTGLVSFGVFVVFGPPTDDLRYTYLLFLTMIGLYVLQSLRVKSRWTKALCAALLLGCTANNVLANGLVTQYLYELQKRHPTQDLIDYLKAHEVKAAVGDYWIAYKLSFTSDGAIAAIPALEQNPWVRQLQPIFLSTPLKNRAEIRFVSCLGGTPVGIWYVCPLSLANKQLTASF